MALPYLRNRYVLTPCITLSLTNLFALIRLQVQSTRAILCVGEWCRKGVLKDKDILAALKGGPEEALAVADEEDLEDGWDLIVV